MVDKSSRSFGAPAAEAPDGGDAASAAAPAGRRTRLDILAAAERCLRRDGFADLSTRRIAELAGTPLSQIHYHFGSKQGLMLALLEHLNAGLLERQAGAFAEPAPLARRWERACDFLDEDLASGYVRVLQEMIAYGWTDPEIAAAVRAALRGWFELIAALAAEAEARFGGVGPFSAAEMSALVGAAFLGGEAVILLGMEGEDIPVRRALRRFGALIAAAEARSA